MNALHPFDSGIALEQTGPDRMHGRTLPEWANMVGPFGGITAATLLHAIEMHPECHGQPIALTVNYAAPIADGNFDIVLHAVRTNRTNQHWIVELRQDGETKTTGTAVFGIRRDTWTDDEAVAPVVPAPKDVVGEGSAAPVVWTKNYQMVFVEGALPGSDAGANPSSTTTLWMRDNPPRRLDFASLTALCDLFFPRVFLRQGRMTPAGTISLSIQFHADQEQLDAQGDDFVLGTARANRFSRGYFDQTAVLWSRTGALLATTQQVVYFKG